MTRAQALGDDRDQRNGAPQKGVHNRKVLETGEEWEWLELKVLRAPRATERRPLESSARR